MKLLHVTRHAGLKMEVEATMRHVCCVDVQTFAFNDGVNVDDEEASLNYNVHCRRAQPSLPGTHTAPGCRPSMPCYDVTAMARPFLQQPLFAKLLFIRLCNRFDFANQDHEFDLAHSDIMQHGYFPDHGYHSLMHADATKANVTILLSNRFEGHYALHWRGVDWPNAALLYPAG